MSALPKTRWSEADYLKLDGSSDVKYEYLFGEVYAMAGTNYDHSLIVGALSGIFYNQLFDTDCVSHSSDLRVKIPDANYVYPDTVVVCGEPQIERIYGVDTLFNPIVVFEILSSSTRSHDENDKALQYRRIESLQEYVLVSPFEMYVLQQTRRGEIWVPRELHKPEDVLYLSSINCQIKLDLLYRRVVFKR